jgi:serine kinase of HPr protein (carbohydrate metabolism regulator)
MSETVHGTAVLVGAQGVLIRGASGAGKSSLALALIERGGRLIADDQVHLSVCHGRLVATAPGAVRGKIELRGRGLLSVAHEQSALIRLVVDIVPDEGLERLPEDHQLSGELLGVTLSRQPVPATHDLSPALVLAALRALSPGGIMACARREFGDDGDPFP